MFRQVTPFLVVCMLIAVISIPPVASESGFWDTEVANVSGTSRYRVYYDLPDEIKTNSTQTINVRFVVLQIAGNTVGVETKSIELQLNANGKTRSWTVVQETKRLKANETWGPFSYSISVLDSDFDLKPQQSLTALFTLSVSFKEIASIPPSAEYDHDATKGNISTELVSSRTPTTIDYLSEYLALFGGSWQLALAVTIGIVIVISISIKISIRIKRVLFRFLRPTLVFPLR